MCHYALSLILGKNSDWEFRKFSSTEAKQIALYILKRGDKIFQPKHFIHYKNIVVKIKFSLSNLYWGCYLYQPRLLQEEVYYKRDASKSKILSTCPRCPWTATRPSPVSNSPPPSISTGRLWAAGQRTPTCRAPSWRTSSRWKYPVSGLQINYQLLSDISSEMIFLCTLHGHKVQIMFFLAAQSI